MTRDEDYPHDIRCRHCGRTYVRWLPMRHDEGDDIRILHQTCNGGPSAHTVVGALDGLANGGTKRFNGAGGSG